MAELERCVREHGFLGPLVNDQTDGPYLDESQYEPVWEAFEAFQVPLLPVGYRHHVRGKPVRIETVIVMLGAFTTGTNQFPDATHASDEAASQACSALDPLVARNEAATADLVPEGVDADPSLLLRR